MIIGATGKKSFIGVPLDLLDNFIMAIPFDLWNPWVINVPEVDEFAFAGDCNVFGVLPLDLKAIKIRVNVTVVEAGDFSTVCRLAVPDIDLTHYASCSDQVVRLLTELAIHEILIEVLTLGDIDVALLVDPPDASYHV